ncbi:MAG: type III pantothenate kinase [Planctomycetota bacterium]|nr:MAG: type III pantothenate kinase [Planctomycetota bacterium]
MIAPGGRMQLRALHEGTSSLPAVALAAPDREGDTFAKTTPEAMLHGVYFGVRGLVRTVVERFAARFGAYPTVIATGGDAALFFDDDEFVERIVPDLTLRGIALAAQAALADAPEDA